MANYFLGFPVSRARFAEFAETCLTNPYDVPGIFQHQMYPSLDNLIYTAYGAGLVTCQGGYVQITSNGGANAGGYIRHAAQYPTVPPDFAKVRAFKSKVYVQRANDPLTKIFAFTGLWNGSKHGFGFSFDHTKIQGICAKTDAVSTVDLITGLATSYTVTKKIEAKLTPGSKVQYYIDDVLLGEITTNIPTGTSIAIYLFSLSLQSDGASTSVIRCSEALIKQAP